MQNEDNFQDDTVSSETDRLLDSPSDIQVEAESTEAETDTTEESEESESSERSENSEETETETEETEETSEEETGEASVISEEEETETSSTAEVIDYTESLTEINTTLHHIDSTVEYGACLLIIVLVIILMRYVYKFFNMFF